ncbi:MAG: hypothetical protein LN588_01915 [Rickettsia endosymbiont of Bryobia graminum]|nr:hypothetical protein [Rickettsia endosymbiont of Bryobia graminum]
MSESYIDYSEFNLEGAASTGGVTGSKKVLRSGANYQLKPSIQDAPIVRRKKAGSMDRENFGEFIAAAISKAVAGQDQDVELVPEVSLVYDKSRKKVLVASKYLQNVKGTLDDFAEKNRGAQISGRHVKISADLEVKNNLNLGNTQDSFENAELRKADQKLNAENAILRKDLAQGIGLSILCGDHDVNPGNMLVVQDQEGKERIARIDFGHAFNDLLNAPKMFGGGVRNKHNLVLDFLNRQELAGFPAAKTKLWRDYQGIVPSQELVNAFNHLGKSNGLKDGLENAKKPFQELIDDLLKDPKTNQDVLDHIKNSLIAINKNISNDQISSDTGIKDAFNRTFKSIGKFYQENQEQMLDVAQLMDMQLKVDQVIIAKKNHKEIDQLLINEIQNAYKELLDKPGIGNGEKLNWVKSSQNIAGFEGTLGEFVKRRAINLGVAVEGEIKDIDDFVKKVEISNPAVKDIVNESALVASFLEDSVKVYIEEKRGRDIGNIKAEEVIENTKYRLEARLGLWESGDWVNANPLEKESLKNMQEIAKNLKNNLDDYVKIMDKKLTESRDKILKEQNIDPKKAEPKELMEAMQQVSTDNMYTKMGKDVINKGHLMGKEGDTIWKSLSSFCSSIGLERLGKFFEHKNEQSKLKIVSQKIGIATHAVERVATNIKKGAGNFSERVTNKVNNGNHKKNDVHTH